MLLKFVYSEKATKLCKSPLYFRLYVMILWNFVSFSEYMNFNTKDMEVFDWFSDNLSFTDNFSDFF